MPTSAFYDTDKVFLHSTIARDIAEPLPSFDVGTPVAEARAVMEACGFPLAGVRENGFVTGWIERECAGDGTCGAIARPIDPAAVLPDTASLPALIAALNMHDSIFVRMLGVIGGYVTRRDLQDPPVRMWLFGLINTYELRLTRTIARHYAAEEWAVNLSPARMEKARAMQEERRRRNQNDILLRCLQFSDKMQIVARDAVLRAEMGLASRKRAEFAAKELERLRNNLAHAQDIVETDWELITWLADRIDSYLHHTTLFDPSA
jgi:hypothetical protein